MTMAGADGRFKLMGLTPGQSYNLVAWREGLGTRIIRGVQAGDSIELIMVDEGRLEVRLGGSGGTGHRLVRIEHQGVPDGELAYSMDLRTDALGFVEFRGLPQGGYRVLVRDDDFRASLGLVESVVGIGETSRVSVDLDDLRRKHGSVRGLVSDHEQVGAVSLRLVSRDNPRDVHGTVSTASDGRFHFTGVPPGAYVVVGRRSNASHDELAKQVTVEAGATTEIELALEHK